MFFPVPSVKILRAGISIVAVIFTTLNVASSQTVNTLVSLDLFGEQVDIVKVGYWHWSGGSGDTVDPDGDANDLSNSFGDHAGHIDNPTFYTRYESGNVNKERLYVEAVLARRTDNRNRDRRSLLSKRRYMDRPSSRHGYRRIRVVGQHGMLSDRSPLRSDDRPHAHPR